MSQSSVDTATAPGVAATRATGADEPLAAAAPVATVRRRRGRPPFPPLRGLAPLALLLVSWQVFGNVGSAYFPPPSTWWTAVRELNAQGMLWPAVGQTTEAFALSLVLATVAGSAIGLLVGRFRRVDRALNPTLEFLRTMPAAVLVPVFTLLLGYHLSMKILVTVVASMWPILLATRSAMVEMTPLRADVAKTFRLSRAAAVRKVFVPSMLPSVFLGVKVAAPFTLIITLLVEILTSINGIGALISKAQSNYESATVYGLVAVAGIIALMVNVAVVALEAYAVRYKEAA